MALSRMSWSLNTAYRLMECGVLRAIFYLHTIDDRRTQEHCAITLCNLAHDPKVVKVMIEERATALVVQLSNEDSVGIKHNCAVTLALIAAHEQTENKIGTVSMYIYIYIYIYMYM